MAHSDQFCSREELLALGFERVGQNLQISRKCSFYATKGSIGDNVRIDDFCILKGQIVFGSYVHIGAFSMVSGAHGTVNLGDCTGLSAGVYVYTGTDIYAATSLSNPTIPENLVRTRKGNVAIRTGAVIGAHTIVLPNTVVGEGASIGAQCIAFGHIPRGAVVVNKGAKGEIVSYRDWEKIVGLAEDLIEQRRTN